MFVGVQVLMRKGHPVGCPFVLGVLGVSRPFVGWPPQPLFVHGYRYPFARHLHQLLTDCGVGGEIGQAHAFARVVLALFVGNFHSAPRTGHRRERNWLSVTGRLAQPLPVIKLTIAR
jgi:hypothetical protein